MASTIKVDNVQNQPGTNIVSKCGTDVTIGASGDTVALASGASQTGFGKTGAVNWDTASIKTATFTAVSGNGYFCNTTGGVFNITMPASPTAGDIVGLKDYAGTFATNNLTIDRNGSKLDGSSSNYDVNTDYTSLTMVYVDGTQGWVPIEEGTGNLVLPPAFVAATGGTISTVCTNYKVHKFTGPGTFCVSCAGNPLGSATVDYMVVAGGGGTCVGNPGGTGGGGAGGWRASSGAASGCYTAGPAPLTGPVSGLAVPVAPYAITVGGGGTAGPAAARGSNSIFSSITSTGGGAPNNSPSGNFDGGSGGGGMSCQVGASGNTPPTTPSQGNDGGGGVPGVIPSGTYIAGGGGGATACGADGSPSGAGVGGAGSVSHITAGPVSYAGGGGGASGREPYGTPVPGGAGGLGGGGAGGAAGSGTAGGCNTGGGGGGGGYFSGAAAGAAGGSGIVIIRYKFQ